MLLLDKKDSSLVVEHEVCFGSSPATIDYVNRKISDLMANHSFYSEEKTPIADDCRIRELPETSYSKKDFIHQL